MGANCGMDVIAELEAEVDPDRLFAVLADLSTYSHWLDIVGGVADADPEPHDAGPAWWVDLRGQLGPFRRSKRLRMVRTVSSPNDEVVFTRREVDGKSHSDWTLRADMRTPSPGSTGVHLSMRLHYGGSLWVPLLDRLLADEVERSRPRLVALVEGAA